MLVKMLVKMLVQILVKTPVLPLAPFPPKRPRMPEGGGGDFGKIYWSKYWSNTGQNRPLHLSHA
jgi:hypothetical protein